VLSPVIVEKDREETVSNGFPSLAYETVKTVSEGVKYLCTGLKRGVNETTFEAKLIYNPP
jgi:hypothetical protein